MKLSYREIVELDTSVSEIKSDIEKVLDDIKNIREFLVSEKEGFSADNLAVE